ncbi:MAG TPA: hypothetical protein VGL35_00175 [Rhizomicrobium sp.]|jgi:tetratricopeptide (TPR) repeat protein
MRTPRLFGALTLAFALSPGPTVLAQSFFNSWSRCTDARLSPERRIAFCTRLLNNGGGPNSEIAVLTALGALYRQEHRYPDAIQSYSRAIAYESLGVAERRESVISPGSQIALPTKGALTGALEGRAELYALIGKPDLALADTAEIFRLSPDAAISYAIRCRVRTIAKTDLDKALADCTQAMKRDSANTQVLGAAGLLQYRLGHLKDAAADFDRALTIDPKLAGALYVRGVIALKGGDARLGNTDVAAAKAKNPSISDSFSELDVAP